MQTMPIFKEISGKTPIKIWTEDCEGAALEQAHNLSTLDFINSHIALMPDVHAGVGATIGSVIPTINAVIPAAVGVDIGCVDKDTEFLTSNGWKKISEYKDGDLVTQYNKENGMGELVEPIQYIDQPNKGFFKLKTKYGINQKLSHNHKMLIYKIVGRDRRLVEQDILASNFVEKHNSLVLGMKARFKTTFIPSGGIGLDMTDDEIRAKVMVSADGSSCKNAWVLRLKKDRKIERARTLIKNLGINFSENVHADGSTVIRFVYQKFSKGLEDMWGANLDQLKLICDEAMHWDGCIKESCFYTSREVEADFMHYAFNAMGKRVVKRSDFRAREGRQDSLEYRVFHHENTMVGLEGKNKIEFEKAEPNDREYCFAVPSGYLVLRRGGNIFITGNCGMSAIQTNLRAEDLPDSLKALRLDLEQAIPVGFNQHQECVGSSDWQKVTGESWEKIVDKNSEFGKGLRNANSNKKWQNQAGTLGGGNHFVEVCLDESGRVWVMLHSGSRGIGNMIGSHFIREAKKLMGNDVKLLPDKNLAYLKKGDGFFERYIEAVNWAQKYAFDNREIMMRNAMKVMRTHFPQMKITKEAINCHHNYISEEFHYGKECYVTRKGAIRAYSGEFGIIPGSMGAKSFIVKGKGSHESFCSCSHGAGRKMSRTEAKKRFSIEDLKKQTIGVECDIREEVIDEIPGAYKDIDKVMENQKDLVEVVHTLKQVLCLKG